MNDIVARHLANHHIPEYSDISGSKKNITRFVLSYYDTFVLLAILPDGIGYVNDTMMRDLNVYKSKVYFAINYRFEDDSFELAYIIYLAPISKCIRVLTAIKRTLSRDYAVGSDIQQTRQDKKYQTRIYLQKV